MAEFLGSLVLTLGHALLHFLWQGALIGLLAALALHALRHARPQARYAVACLALLACVLVPLVSVVTQLATASFTPLQSAAPALVPGMARPSHPQVLLAFVPSVARFDALSPWIVAFWAAGAVVMFSRMALGLVWIRGLRNAPPHPAQAVWQRRLDALAMRFGLRRPVTLCLVDTVDSPVSAGWWSPIVVLPAALLTRMPTALIEALLAHELAHIRRHDYLVNLLQNAIEALLFYHPVIWWLSQRIRIEREQIADQLAAEMACVPRNLALALSELADLRRERPPFHLAQAAAGGHLRARIERLVRPVRRDRPAGRFALPFLGLAAAGIVSYSYAHMRSADQAAMAPFNRTAQAIGAGEAPVRQTFALVNKGTNRITIWGPDDEMTETQATERAGQGDLLWVRRNGQDYVITDPALLSRARLAWSEAEALEGRMARLDHRMDAHYRKAEAVGGRPEALTIPAETSSEPTASEPMQALERRYEALRREQENAAERAARDVGRLISEALMAGLATPA